jgi:tetratricopeptide (TPR) repeat protein
MSGRVRLGLRPQGEETCRSLYGGAGASLAARRCARLLAIALISLVLLSFTERGQYSGWLASVGGGTTIRLTGGTEFRPAVVREKLAAGDVLRTGPNGNAVLVFEDGSQCKMKPNTTLIVPAVRAGARRLKLEQGTIYMRMARQKGKDTAIQTPAAVAGIRGTEFQLDVEEDGRAILTVVEGEVEFANDHGAVRVRASEQSSARADAAPTRPVVVDPSGIIAWEATVDSLVIPIEDPLVSGRPAELERELKAREAAAQAGPEDAAAQVRLGDVLQDMGRLSDAAAAYARALAIRPNDRTAREHLALLRLREGRAEEALAVFSPAVAAAVPAAVEGPFGEGLVRLAVGDVEQAVPRLERAALSSPDNPRPATFLGLARLRQGQTATAAALLRRAAEIGPDYYPAQAYLSYALTVRGDLKGAEEAAQRAVALAPESPLAREALANAHFFAGRHAAARREVARALAANPLSASAHLLDAKLLVAANRLPEGIEAAQRAVGIDPRNAVAHTTLGVLYLADKDRRYAESEFKQAVAIAPGLAPARTGLASLYARRGEFTQALNENQAALALDGGSAAAHNNIGAIYLAEGKLDAAITEFQAAIDRQPEWGLPHANLALAYLEQHRYKQAVDTAETAVRLGENSAPLHTTLARVYMAQRRFDRARYELRAAIGLDPDYAQAHFQYAQVLLDRREDRDATRSLLQGSIRDPGAITESRLYARSDLSLAGGSFGGNAMDGKTSGIAKQGDLSYYVTGLREESDGHRDQNSDTRDRFGLGLFGLQSSGDHRWLLYGTLFDRAGGRPGREVNGRVEDPNYRSEFGGRELHLLHRLSTGNYSKLTLKVGVRDREINDRNPDSLAPTPEFAADPKPFQRLETRVEEILGEARWDARFGDRDHLTLGVAVSDQERKARGLLGKLEPTDVGTVFRREWVEERESPLTTTLYAEWRRALGRRLTLTLGNYWGRESGTGSVSRPKFVAHYRPDRASNIAFLAYPSFRMDVSDLAPVELWAQPFGFDLLGLVEDGAAMSYELHYDRSLNAGGAVSLSAFTRRVNGLLLDLEDPEMAPAPSRLPVRRAAINGAQAAYEQWLSRAVTGRVWVRYQETSDRATGLDLPYFADWQGGLRFDYLDRAGWRGALGATWIGSRYVDSENSRRLGGFFLLDLRLSRQIGLRQNLYVQVNNLLGRRYQRYEGYPEAGRTISGGVEWRF